MSELNIYLSEEHKANLRKLAVYLMGLPDNYDKFDMAIYMELQGRNIYEVNPRIAKQFEEIPNNETCGTCACALGHGPLAGIYPEHKDVLGWSDYLLECFGILEISKEYNWIFADHWDKIDNTPKGAAARILYMLDNGLPDIQFYDEPGITEIYKDYIK